MMVIPIDGTAVKAVQGSMAQQMDNGGYAKRMVSISEKLAGEQMQQIVVYTRSEADVRADRLRRIRRAIVAGTYFVSSQQLAECLMEKMGSEDSELRRPVVSPVN